VPAGDEQVGEDTESEDIGAAIDELPLNLFRRHVGELALDLAHSRVAIGALGLRHAEVDDLDDTVVSHEHVLR
jgi:hypothetical protein